VRCCRVPFFSETPWENTTRFPARIDGTCRVKERSAMGSRFDFGYRKCGRVWMSLTRLASGTFFIVARLLVNENQISF
jgi:hypothetical protein